MRAHRRVAVLGLLLSVAPSEATEPATLEQIKTEAAARSKYLSETTPSASVQSSAADLGAFRKEIEPILAHSCVGCHGPEQQKAKFRVDTLDPDLVHGEDADWWLEVMDVLSNGEMPPKSGPELGRDDRSRVIDWLSSEIRVASQVRRSEQGHSSFRRMTRYEYNYALQDLLGLPLDFAKDLPPDPVSVDGFRNSSEMLRMTPSQYSTYLDLNRKALQRATVRGKQPEMLYWGVSAERASASKFEKLKESASRARSPREGGRQRGRRGGRSDRGAHYKHTVTGQTVAASWSFRRAVHAWEPTMTLPEVPEPSEYMAMLPAGERLVVELGNRLPDTGTLRVRVRASKVSSDDELQPSIALEFGWQGHNNSKASFRISRQDLVIGALPGEPEFYQWEVPLSEIYPRNPVRKTVALGTPKMTNPSEYIRFHNSSLARDATVQFDYVEVSAPVYEEWPPASHKTIFIESESREDELAYAREIVARFMSRAWRRDVTEAEIDGKIAYFVRIRPVCQDFQQAMIEVLATVLSSPRFLYLVQGDSSKPGTESQLDSHELATRLSLFLWCSTPDDELLELAGDGRLDDPEELVRQAKRLLADPRHKRFSKHFVEQWLGMELLDYLTVDRSTYPDFDGALKEAMRQEPVAFFEEVLQGDRTVMDFLHADYALVNERLAKHYGIDGVKGPHFQKVSLAPGRQRGGLLTQAGLLAMNSDGKDSHPLKRGIWLLENLLNDPPPPPPPAVPEIDLADPEILKLTLKERMENHRSQPACFSCHVKIDPWGIAFENFDAVGGWRDQIQGKDVDASSLLYNEHLLDGMDGLKRYLLASRQDQFCRAFVYKMCTFALGRPLTFADRAGVDRLTAAVRGQGDGLATLVSLIVNSDLFRTY